MSTLHEKKNTLGPEVGGIHSNNALETTAYGVPQVTCIYLLGHLDQHHKMQLVYDWHLEYQLIQEKKKPRTDSACGIAWVPSWKKSTTLGFHIRNSWLAAHANHVHRDLRHYTA